MAKKLLFNKKRDKESVTKINILRIFLSEQCAFSSSQIHEKLCSYSSSLAPKKTKRNTKQHLSTLKKYGVLDYDIKQRNYMLPQNWLTPTYVRTLLTNLFKGDFTKLDYFKLGDFDSLTPQAYSMQYTDIFKQPPGLYKIIEKTLQDQSVDINEYARGNIEKEKNEEIRKKLISQNVSNEDIERIESFQQFTKKYYGQVLNEPPPEYFKLMCIWFAPHLRASGISKKDFLTHQWNMLLFNSRHYYSNLYYKTNDKQHIQTIENVSNELILSIADYRAIILSGAGLGCDFDTTESLSILKKSIDKAHKLKNEIKIPRTYTGLIDHLIYVAETMYSTGTISGELPLKKIFKNSQLSFKVDK